MHTNPSASTFFSATYSWKHCIVTHGAIYKILSNTPSTHTHTGAEPVATALSFTLVLIHLNPEEGLKPLMSEIDEVLGKKKTITVDDLEKLKYTEQVTKLTDSFKFIL